MKTVNDIIITSPPWLPFDPSSLHHDAETLAKLIMWLDMCYAVQINPLKALRKIWYKHVIEVALAEDLAYRRLYGCKGITCRISGVVRDGGKRHDVWLCIWTKESWDKADQLEEDAFRKKAAIEDQSMISVGLVEKAKGK